MTGVLVTGATTPLGGAIVRALVADPRVDALIAVGVEPRPVELAALSGERAGYVSVDLTRGRDLHDLLFGPVRKLGLDVVIHTALHRRARAFGPDVHALHVEATRNLLMLAERHPTLRRFVFRSSANVYRIDPARATLIDEDEPLELLAECPDDVRERVEADLTVCTRMGLSSLEIVVLRLAEILAPNVGSQLDDYLSSRVCLRPLGFDPMLNVLSLEDAADAIVRAALASGNGIFNITGADTLPLSRAIALSGRACLPLPGPLLAPLYRVRASAFGMEFRYDLNHRRFHFSAVLDGTRAREALGYEPHHRVAWKKKPPRTAPEGASALELCNDALDRTEANRHFLEERSRVRHEGEAIVTAPELA